MFFRCFIDVLSHYFTGPSLIKPWSQKSTASGCESSCASTTAVRCTFRRLLALKKVSEIIDDSRFKGTYIFLKCTHFFMFFMFNHSMLAMNGAALPSLERMQTVKPDFTPHSPFRNCHAFSPSPFPSSFSGMVAGWAGCGLIS